MPVGTGASREKGIKPRIATLESLNQGSHSESENEQELFTGGIKSHVKVSLMPAD